MWRPIAGFKGRYEVSDDGQIRRLPFVDAYGHRQQMKILSQSYGCQYAAVYVTVDQRKSGILVHRAMAQAFIPNPLGLPEVNHIDGNKRNNNLANLEWVSTQGNAIHARRTELRRQKLTNDQVAEIRRLFVPNRRNGYRDGNCTELAQRFNVTREQIRNVASGRHWAWLKS